MLALASSGGQYSYEQELLSSRGGIFHCLGQRWTIKGLISLCAFKGQGNYWEFHPSNRVRTSGLNFVYFFLRLSPLLWCSFAWNCSLFWEVTDQEGVFAAKCCGQVDQQVLDLQSSKYVSQQPTRKGKLFLQCFLWYCYNEEPKTCLLHRMTKFESK